MNNFKTSYYTVISDPIIKGKYQIVYSTRTAKKILLSTEIIKDLKSESFNKINPSIIRNLIESKIIVPFNENELSCILNIFKDIKSNNTKLTYTISSSGNCQLGCGYCGQVHNGGLLSDLLQKKILHRIEEKLRKDNIYKELHINWFGGEPLLGLGSIKELTPLLRELAYKYKCKYKSSMISNGLLLTKDTWRIISDELNINEMEVTLDGTSVHHDKLRHTKSGKSTFNRILKNLTDFLSNNRFHDTNTKVNLRCNISKANAESIFDLVDILDKKEILHSFNKIYIAPLHSWGNDAHHSGLSKEDFSKLEIRFFIYLLNKEYIRVLTPIKPFQFSCMAVHRASESIDTNGDIFCCTEISYVPLYKMKGSNFLVNNLQNNDQTKDNKRPMTTWFDKIKESNIPCSECNILPLCGGSCPKSWSENHSPCPSLKKNIGDRLIFDSLRELQNLKKN